MPACMTVSRDGVILRVKVVPGAAKTAVQGLLGNALKVRVQAPPEKGKANRALLQFVSSRLNVPACNVTLKSGGSDRIKRLLVTGIRQTDIAARLNIT